MSEQADTNQAGLRRCPVCAEPMTVQAVGATEIDVCAPHGVWLDAGELEAITRRLERRNERARRHAVREAKFTGKTQGWLLGPLAHLFE